MASPDPLTRLPVEEPHQAPFPGRRPYQSPELVCFGTLAELTQGDPLVGADGGPLATSFSI